MTRQDQKTLSDVAMKAMRSAVRKIHRARKNAGEPIYVLKNGRVAKVLLAPPKPSSPRP